MSVSTRAVMRSLPRHDPPGGGDRREREDRFAELYREHAGQVYATCLRMAGDAQTAGELTQDVFVKAWEKLGTFRGEGEIGGWLKRIAVNLSLNAFRSARRRTDRVETTDDLLRFDRGSSEAPPETRIVLEAAIAKLPDRARMVFVMFDIEGYRQEEIAEEMEITVGTVKAQLHRARMLLREALQ